ncbi:hypothetical protein [Clostridium sp. BNL1100]|uniref:hypothetical protein n=1 Tax=Clostridium sp. BNL1100 TaxID=755731 RepID=UPI00024A7759|nr:hypothetical protein [Clostridium sp. BNL1100]AEY67832.1 hypothetical protein Clo1100_3713 [Clostridium sp. BNL1100]
MTVLERLKLELSNKEYFTDQEYTTFLQENNLTATDNYDKTTMQKSLLFAVIDILEAVSNNVDLMRRVETEFLTTTDAAKFLKQRIQDLKDRIASIPDVNEEYSPFSLMFTRK